MGILSDVLDELLPANDPHAQVLELCWKAQCAFNWSHLDEARLLATRAFELLPSESWYRSGALHHLHQLLGLLDLKNDDRRAAKEHLSASAGVETTPFLSSFGPSMLLADALLKLGEREAVLDYFDACRQLWGSAESRLKVWSEQVREGRFPDSSYNRHQSSATAPLCWELRRSDTVLGRLYLRTKDNAWFVCTFEPMADFTDMQESLQHNFRDIPDDTSDLEDAYGRLQELQLVLHPGDGGPPVTDAVIQVQSDTAYFRY